MTKLKYTDIVQFNFKNINGSKGTLHQKDHMKEVYRYEDGKKTDEVIGYRGDFLLEHPDDTVTEFSCKFDEPYFYSYGQKLQLDFDYERTKLWSGRYGIETTLWGKDLKVI